jgi:predicted porin
MKKTAISAAILLASAGAAHAQLQLYGLIDMSYGLSIADDSANRKADFHSGGDSGSAQGNSTSRFGLKGSTDVGAGIKANFRLESNGIQSDGSINSPFFARQAWVGFSGNFGELRLGRQDSVPFQTMIGYDFNGASNGASSFGAASAAIWALRDRQSRSLQYISPKLGNSTTVQLGFVPKGNDAAAKAVASAGLTFASGDLSVSAAYEGKRTASTDDFVSISGSYDFKVVKVMAGYSDGGAGQKGVNAGFTAPIGSINVGALFAHNSDTKGRAIELFVNSEVLKNTYAYLEVGAANAKTGTKGTGYAVGVIYVF